MAALETIVYHLGINNLDKDYLYYGYFFELMFKTPLEPRYMHYVDFIFIFLLLWLISLVAIHIKSKTIIHERENIFLHKVVEISIESCIAYLFFRYILDSEHPSNDILLSAIFGIAIYFFRKYLIKKKLPIEKITATIVWTITFIVVFQYYIRKSGFVTITHGDIGHIKDIISILVLFSAAIFLYSNIDVWLKKGKIEVFIMIIAIFVVAVIITVVDITYPTTELGRAYANDLLSWNNNIDVQSSEYIGKLQIILNNHVLIRTAILLFLGVVAPFVIYGIVNYFKMKKIDNIPNSKN